MDAIPRPGAARPTATGRPPTTTQGVFAEFHRVLHPTSPPSGPNADRLPPNAHRRAGGKGAGDLSHQAAEQKIDIFLVFCPLGPFGPLSPLACGVFFMTFGLLNAALLLGLAGLA